MPPEPLEDRSADEYLAAQEVLDAEEVDSQLNVITFGGDEDADEKPIPTECIVIGYVPQIVKGPDGKDVVVAKELLLATRDEKGQLRYAGKVPVPATSDLQKQWQAYQSRFKALPAAPDYFPKGIEAIPVEPTISCSVNHLEQDKDGRLKNITVQGFGKRR